jgi:apolipoprotein N-acyltransferase
MGNGVAVAVPEAKIVVEQYLDRVRSAGRFRWCLFCVVAAVLPTLPHVLAGTLAPVVTGCIALVAHAPLVAVLGERRPATAGTLATLGGLHGLALALLAAGWVWTFRKLPLAVPAIAALVGVSLYAVVFVAIGAANGAIRRFISRGLGDMLAITTIAIMFTATEVLRGSSPDLFLPLGSVAFGAVSPQLLPVAFVAGIPGLSLFVLIVNGVVAMPALCEVGIPARRQAFPAFVALGAVLAACHAVVIFLAPRGLSPYPGMERGALCAVADHARRERPGGGYLNTKAIGAIVARAQDVVGCGLVALPEVSTFVPRNAIVFASARQPLVIAGVRTVDEVVNGEPFVRTFSTNSICSLALAHGGARCVAKVDKRFLTPFVETELFHAVPLLRRFGAWLTAVVTGDGNTEVAETHGTVIDLAPGLAVGVLVCLEAFLPWQPQRDETGRRVVVPLILIPVDHSYFPPLELIRALKRRAAALQAAAAHTQVLLVSTEEVAMFSAAGRELLPTRVDGEIAAWIVAAREAPR